MERIANPVIYELKYENKMEPHYEGVQETHEKLIFNYPTVYIVHHPEKEKFCVYIGETTDIRRRSQFSQKYGESCTERIILFSQHVKG